VEDALTQPAVAIVDSVVAAFDVEAVRGLVTRRVGDEGRATLAAVVGLFHAKSGNMWR